MWTRVFNTLAHMGRDQFLWISVDPSEALTAEKLVEVTANIKRAMGIAIKGGVPYIVRWPVDQRLDIVGEGDADMPSVICEEQGRKFIVWGSLPLAMRRVKGEEPQ